MAIILKEVLTKLVNIKIEDFYGESGSVNAVTWVHMVESVEIASFITHGELVFLTGIALSEQNKLIDIVKAVYEKNASGIIVNLGPYIDGVSKEVIDFANKHNFPVITVPWSVNMANIMRFISFEITNQRLKEMEFDVAVKNLILTPQNKDSYLNQVNSKSIDINSSVNCILISIETLTEIELNKIVFLLKPSLAFNFNNVAFITIFSKPILVLLNSTREQILDITNFCKNEIARLTNKKSKYFIGKKQVGIENLHKSYKSTIKICRIQCLEDVLFYDELGIYKLLAEIEDKDIVSDFLQETLKPVIDYDNINKSDLMIIMQKYIAYDGSVKAVSDELFIHRNTVNYKLSKISELLDCNLSEQKIRTKLSVALALKDLMPDTLC